MRECNHKAVEKVRASWWREHWTDESSKWSSSRLQQFVLSPFSLSPLPLTWPPTSHSSLSFDPNTLGEKSDTEKGKRMKDVNDRVGPGCLYKWTLHHFIRTKMRMWPKVREVRLEKREACSGTFQMQTLLFDGLPILDYSRSQERCKNDCTDANANLRVQWQ